MNITKDLQSEGSAVNAQNCYIDDGEHAVGTWPLDYLYDGSNGTGYVPNSMDGASYAFNAGRYNQKVYGFISNGKMTVGLTSNGQEVNWVLWANFKLRYEGRSEEALNNILPQTLSQLVTYDETQDLTVPVKSEVSTAIEQANQAIANGNANMKYETLELLYDMLNKAKKKQPVDYRRPFNLSHWHLCRW